MEDGVDMEKLISAIEARPAIWDIGSSEYTDRLQRKKCWEDIINLFAVADSTREEKQILGTLLQKKWKNARDRYTRDHHCRAGMKPGQGVKRKAPYMFAAQMSFLADAVQLRAQASNSTAHTKKAPPSKLHSEIEVKEEPLEIPISNENNVEDSNQEIAEAESIAASNTKAKKAKKKELPPIEAKLIEALENNAKRREARERNENDDDRLFLLSLLPHIKQLPPQMKLKVRMDLLQVVDKYFVESAMTQDQHFDHWKAAEDQDELERLQKIDIENNSISPAPSPSESVHSFFSNNSSDCDVKPL